MKVRPHQSPSDDGGVVACHVDAALLPPLQKVATYVAVAADDNYHDDDALQANGHGYCHCKLLLTTMNNCYYRQWP